MELLYKGKTKDVYKNKEGQIVLTFKDDVTGDDGLFDPGANTVGMQMEGSGLAALRMTTHFFEKINDETDIPTHYISTNINKKTLTVIDAQMFGNGLEVICRYRAVGSFLRRYGAYCEEGQQLNGLIEITVKDDKRHDPPISKDALIELNILNESDYKLIKEYAKKIATMVKAAFANKGLDLYDIKLEFGRHKGTGEIMLIDEISGGNMRVYKGNEIVSPIELATILLKKQITGK